MTGTRQPAPTPTLPRERGEGAGHPPHPPPPPPPGGGGRRPPPPPPPRARGGAGGGAPRSRMTGTRQTAPAPPLPRERGREQDAVSTPPLHAGKGARSFASPRPTL